MRKSVGLGTAEWMATLEKRMSSASIALYADNGRVLVVKAGYKRYWSFPGGVVDVGETPRHAAVRETKEEVGLAVDSHALTFKFVVDRVSAIAQTYQFIFEQRVDESVFERIMLDAEEIEEYALVTRQQILDGDWYYSQSTIRWAEGFSGYAEQQFGAGAQGNV